MSGLPHDVEGEVVDSATTVDVEAARGLNIGALDCDPHPQPAEVFPRLPSSLTPVFLADFRFAAIITFLFPSFKYLNPPTGIEFKNVDLAD